MSKTPCAGSGGSSPRGHSARGSKGRGLTTLHAFFTPSPSAKAQASLLRPLTASPVKPSQEQQRRELQPENGRGTATTIRFPLVPANGNIASDASVAEIDLTSAQQGTPDATAVEGSGAQFGLGKLPTGKEPPAGLSSDPPKSQNGDQTGAEKPEALSEQRVVEFRNKRLYFQEAKLQLDKLASTLTEIIAFREYCDANDADIAEMTAVPDAHLPLLAKLVQDSEKALSALAKEIRSNLCPDGQAAKETSGSQISLQAIKQSIEKIASRIDYGVPLAVVEEMEPSGVTSVPPSLSLFRWEVAEVDLFADQSLRHEILRRRRRREIAAKHAAELFRSADAEVRKELLTKATRAKRGVEPSAESAKKRAKEADAADSAKKRAKEADAAEQAAEKRRKVEEKSRKAQERAAERERREMEKRAKAEEEEARKAAEAEKSMRGQRSIAMFLTATPKQEQKPVKVSNPKLLLLYERFPPFHIKADVELASYNRFEHAMAEGFEDLFPLEKSDAQGARAAIVQESAEELLKADLAEMKRRGERQGLCESVRTRGKKVHHQPDLRLLVQEGGVVDAKVPRSDLEAQGISVKLLQFTEDYRPPYWGTFTRGSSKLSFRTPFSKDPKLFDYEYDSEAEWEQDDEGEELISEDDDDARSQGEAAPSGEGVDEDDDWLVPHGYLSEDEGIESDDPTPKGTPGGSPKVKRKAERDRHQSRPRSAHVAPLVPFVIGPILLDSCDAPSPDSYLNALRWEVL